MYKAVAIGGTFDRLHKGHQFFISKAFELGEKVIIGLTSDRYVKGKVKSPACLPTQSGAGRQKSKVKIKGALRHLPGGQNACLSAGRDSWQVEGFARRKEEVEKSDEARNHVANSDFPEVEEAENIHQKLKIQSYQDRERELRDFLKQEGLIKRAEIVKIHDIYGPAIEGNKIEALLVTSETMRGAIAINKRRRLKHLKPLKILKTPLILADDRRRITSTRIRCGEIDRRGRLCKKSKIT